MSPRSDNNAMNQTNRGVAVSRCGAPSGEPVLAEVGAPFILSLDVAGYCGVGRTSAGLWSENIAPVARYRFSSRSNTWSISLNRSSALLRSAGGEFMNRSGWSSLRKAFLAA